MSDTFAISDPTKHAAAQRLRAALAAAMSLRAQARAEGALAAARERVRSWQAARLARTHRDLLDSPRFGAAAEFFLSELYGTKDLAQRDADVERILPSLAAVLPASGLTTLALAIELDALSEELDAALAGALGGESLDDTSYAQAYRRAGHRHQREQQLELTRQVGETLARLVRKPLLGSAIRLMRKPAHMAGLAQLHAFLESGFECFRKMGDATEFLDTIERRERTIMERLYACHPTPFAVE